MFVTGLEAIVEYTWRGEVATWTSRLLYLFCTTAISRIPAGTNFTLTASSFEASALLSAGLWATNLPALVHAASVALRITLDDTWRAEVIATTVFVTNLITAAVLSTAWATMASLSTTFSA